MLIFPFVSFQNVKNRLYQNGSMEITIKPKGSQNAMRKQSKNPSTPLTSYQLDGYKPNPRFFSKTNSLIALNQKAKKKRHQGRFSCLS
jgi:hypothetical protein